MVAKDDPISELHTAIVCAADGGVHYSPRLAPALARLVASDHKVLGLSPRERQIALLVARGQRSAEILAELGIRRATMKTHLQNIFRKLGVNRRADLRDSYGILLEPRTGPGGRDARTSTETRRV